MGGCGCGENRVVTEIAQRRGGLNAFNPQRIAFNAS